MHFKPKPILEIKIGLKRRTINSNNKRYSKQEHLYKVVKEYLDAANRTVAPYTGWYNFLIPKINLSVVSKELLPIEEIAKALGENESLLKELLDKFHVSWYYVVNKEVIRRTELDRFLNQFHVNGFTKYPH